MTDKKVNILKAALELFATNGYNSTSTSKIAKQAGVSEGLIFRHFDNKKGLLDAIIANGEKKVNEVFTPMLFETDPAKAIEMALRLPFSIPPSEYNYWKLLFKLKWEAGHHNPQKMKPLIDKFTWAFSELGVKQPALEAELLTKMMDTLSISILREGLESQLPLRDFLLSKYLD